MESALVHQNNKVEDVEDEVKKYWIKEFYEKKTRLRLFFERVWYWFIVSLTGILSVSIPVALAILAVNFLPVLLFHMVIEEIILFGVLSTFLGSLAVIGVYYLASLLFSYADKLNDRNNRDNQIDVEKRSPIQRILAGFGFLSFIVATMVVLICLVTFYVDIAAVILCCFVGANCCIGYNFNVFGLWQSINRPAEAAQCCWNIAVHGRSSLETLEKNYDKLEKLYLKRLKKIFFIRSMTDRKILKVMISHYIPQDSEFEKLLDKLGDKMYKERLEQQSRFIVLKYKIMPLVVKLADKTGKFANEIFANNSLLMGNLSVFDDNAGMNNGTNKIYAPAPVPSAQNISNEMSNDMNNNKNEIELLKNELSLVIEASIRLFGAFEHSNNALRELFEAHRSGYEYKYNKEQTNISVYQDMSRNINTFNVNNNMNNQYPNLVEFQAQGGFINNQCPNFTGFPVAPRGFINTFNVNNNMNNQYPTYEEFLAVEKDKTHVPAQENVQINVDGKVNNNNDDNLPSYEDLLADKENRTPNPESKNSLNNGMNNRYPNLDELLKSQDQNGFNLIN